MGYSWVVDRFDDRAAGFEAEVGQDELGEEPDREDDHPMVVLERAPLATATSLVHDAQKAKVFEALFKRSEPCRFGRYVVLGELGCGGMGRVLKAYDESLDRAIAIKLLHSEAAERHTKRLKREAMALAKLSHPNVVHVYEVGQVEGHWFIAMELVNGQTLRQWQQGHNWRECVEVYLQAGEGLSAAHAAGLIHRDFKPDNCIIDWRGQVRVLDFGLAGGHLIPSPTIDGVHTVGDIPVPLTETGTILGTPAYMPPEQMQGGESDTRSDQFSFCVSLYEAVYGERPYAGETLVELLDSALSGTARIGSSRAPVPGRLRQILLQGLEAAPEHRWPSMEMLLAELRRLNAPPTRRWLAMGLAGSIAILGIGLARYAEVGFRCEGSESQLDGIWDRMRQQETKAAVLRTGLPHAPDVWERVLEPKLGAYANAWVTQHEEACEATSIRQQQSTAMLDLRMRCLHRARTELDAAITVLINPDADAIKNAHEITDSLPPLFLCSDIEALAAGLEPPQPEEEPAVTSIYLILATAKAEREAGRYAIAHQKIGQAKELARQVIYEPVHTEIALEEGRTLERLGRYQSSEALLKQAVQAAARQDDQEALQQAIILLIHVVGEKQQRIEEGLVYAHLAGGLAAGNPTSEATVLSSNASLLQRQGKYQDAEQGHRQALLLRLQELGPNHPRVALSRNSLGNTLKGQGRFREAEAEHRLALAITEKALGPSHPNVAQSLSNLAAVLAKQGKYDEAENKHRQGLAIRQAALGPEHPETAASRANLAIVLLNRGKHEEAEAEHRRALASFEEALGSDHPDVATSRHALALALATQGRYQEAEAEYREVLALRERILNPEHPHIAQTRDNLAITLGRQGRYDEAEAEHRAALALRERALGPDHPEVIESRNNLAVTFSLQNRDEEAEREYRRILELWQKSLGPDHPSLAQVRGNLAASLFSQGKHAEAEAEHRRALAQHEKAQGPDHPDVASSRYNLSEVLLERGQTEEALNLAELSWTRRKRDDIPLDDQAESAFLLARALWLTRRDQHSRSKRLAQWALNAYQHSGAAYKRFVEEIDTWLDLRSEHWAGRGPVSPISQPPD